MITVVNCISLFQGGSRTVLLGMIEGFLNRKNSGNQFIFLLPSNHGFEELLSGQIRNDLRYIFLDYPNVRFRAWKKLWIDHVVTAQLARVHSADVILMTGNFACLLTLRPQWVLMHNRNYLGALPAVHLRRKFLYIFERFLVWLGVLKGASYFFQLETIQTQFCKQYNLESNRTKKVTMVPLASFDRNAKPAVRSKDPVRLFFPAKLHPNKNHEFLIPIAKLIQESQIRVEIALTLTADEASSFMSRVATEGLDSIIINLGSIPNDRIHEYYQRMDALFFPTLSESFGLPYVEALLSGLPILTSDLDFAREVCGSAGYYFNPNDAVTAFNEIYRLVQNPKELSTSITLMREQYLHEWSDVVTEMEKELFMSIGPRSLETQS